MTERNISSSESTRLSDINTHGRSVLYEEFAEYFYLFARKYALESSSIQSEVNYHIGNLVLLSLYFDTIFIQTASIFNSKDPFIRKVIKNVLTDIKFREMLNLNIVKIIGWGGNSPKEMFQAAKSFSIKANPNCNDEDYFSVVSSLFNPQSIITRSTSMPDEGLEKLFRRRLEQTTIIRNVNEHRVINEAVDRSLENTGQLVAVSFNPELAKLRLEASLLSAVEISFIQSWHDHLATEIPGITVYAPMTKVIFLEQKIQLGEDEVKTFLYSPQIFASFLSGYLSSADFNKILLYPYDKLMAIKNGDWRRFCDAYHKAVATVSEDIGHLDYFKMSDDKLFDEDQWSSKLSKIIIQEAQHMDINSFMESLAMLSGVFFSIPYLGPLVQVIGHLAGKRLNDLYQSFRTNVKIETSPFIIKLIRHYELAGAHA